MNEILMALNYCIVFYFAAMGLTHTILLLASFPDIMARFKEAEYGNVSQLINQERLIPITTIVPAFNEEKRILNSVLSIMRSQYKNVKIIVVNDGSSDNTVKLLVEHFQMYAVPVIVRKNLSQSKIFARYESSAYPNLMVIDKEHTNTGDTLNVGIDACSTPIFASVDADTLLEPEAITRIMFTFLSQPHCIAVGGAVYVLNGAKIKDGEVIESRIPDGLVAALQVPEYLRSFMFGRAGWNTFGGSLSYAGAFTVFETQAVVQAGGYDLNNFAQDAEIIVKLRSMMTDKKYPHSIHFTPSAFAWTEVPSTVKRYWIQRNHWQRGLMRSLFAFKQMFFNPKYKVVGLFTYPFFIFFEVFGGFIEGLAYITFALGWYCHVSGIAEVTPLCIALAWGYLAILTLASASLNLITFNKYHRPIDILQLLSLTIIELVGFRQMHVLCRCVATVEYGVNRLRGKKL